MARPRIHAIRILTRWILVGTGLVLVLLFIGLGLLAATTYAESIGIPVLAVDIAAAIAGLLVLIVGVREIRRLRELHAAVQDDTEAE